MGMLCYPAHGTLDGVINDPWSIFIDPALGNQTVYQMPGNHSRVIVADAFNYVGEDNFQIEEGLEYEWKFNSDSPKKYGLEGRKAIKNKTVSRSKKLSLINANIFDTGYYHCIIKSQ